MQSSKPPMVVSFSGGETSGMMSKYIKDKYGETHNVIFIFSNTGCENDETLDFVHACDQAFGLDVRWIEAVVDPRHGHGIRHRLTNYKDAMRVKDYKNPLHPFHAHIAKSGIPNANKPQCSDRLKAFAIEDYKKHLGVQGCPHAIGMRSDEPNRLINAQLRVLLGHLNLDADAWRTLPTHEKRMKGLSGGSLLGESAAKPEFIGRLERYSKKLAYYGLFYPLADVFSATKADVNAFWESQPFRLRLEEHEGNCQVCWKKSDKKLMLLALERPERFEAFDYWEKTYAQVKPNNDGQPRVFFRRHRSAEMLVKEAQSYDATHLRRMIGASRNEDNSSGCSESCDSYQLLND